MSLTIAQAMEQIESLGRELAVWREVESFLQGFVRQEEQDSVKRVITTEEWKSKGTPPLSIVVPEEAVKKVIKQLVEVEIGPRQEQVNRLRGLSVKEETANGSGSAEDRGEEDEKQGEPKSSSKGPAKPGRAKLKVTPENPGARKTGRRLVPKPA